ncbi:MAG: hypothetical protein AAB601_00785 [Patescibacteria group bacterium]
MKWIRNVCPAVCLLFWGCGGSGVGALFNELERIDRGENNELFKEWFLGTGTETHHVALVLVAQDSTFIVATTTRHLNLACAWTWNRARLQADLLQFSFELRRPNNGTALVTLNAPVLWVPEALKGVPLSLRSRAPMVRVLADGTAEFFSARLDELQAWKERGALATATVSFNLTTAAGRRLRCSQAIGALFEP